VTLAKRIKANDISDEKTRAFYYSSWFVSAIHMTINIPELQTPKVLSKHFRTEEVEVSKILEQLSKFGLAVKRGSNWSATHKMIHLPRSSIFTSMNHLN